MLTEGMQYLMNDHYQKDQIMHIIIATGKKPDQWCIHYEHLQFIMLNALNIHLLFKPYEKFMCQLA